MAPDHPFRLVTLCILMSSLFLSWALAYAVESCNGGNNWDLFRSEIGAEEQPTSCSTSLPPTGSCSSASWRVGQFRILDLVPAIPSTVTYLEYTCATREACCKTCGNKNTRHGISCAYWQHYIPPVPQQPSWCSGHTTAATGMGVCTLYPPGHAPQCETRTCQDALFPNFGKAANLSTIGLGCSRGLSNRRTGGAQGSPSELRQLADQNICLITETNFQVNVKIRGYHDSHTMVSTILNDGKKARTWIKALGIIWIDRESKKKHGLQMTAREGIKQKRGTGFLGAMMVDDKAAPKMLPGDRIRGDGGLNVKFAGHEVEETSSLDVDLYRVQVAGVLDAEVRVRLAHPLLQTPSDAIAHLNVNFLEVANSTKTHGLLGQTLQPRRKRQDVDFGALSFLLDASVPADGKLGADFLDGSAKDYHTSSLLSADCRFSASM